jgi:hypothetical protein
MDLRAKKRPPIYSNEYRKPEREVRTVSAVTNPIYQLNSVRTEELKT